MLSELSATTKSKSVKVFYKHNYYLDDFKKICKFLT